jgi:hypothetical protein
MMTRFHRFAGMMIVLAGLGLTATPAFAAGEGCSDFKWPLTEEQALFSSAQTEDVASVSRHDALSRTALAVRLANSVDYVLAPERVAKDGMPNGAVLTFSNVASGTYQITLSDEAWIDVVQNGALVPSIDHTGAKDCAGLRKSVRFRLREGPVTIQLSSAAVTRIKMAVRPVR